MHKQVSDLIRDLEDEREAVRLQQEELESMKAELQEKNKQLQRERKDVEKKKVCNAHTAATVCCITHFLVLLACTLQSLCVRTFWHAWRANDVVM
jgi:hypothetical protein